MNVKQLALYAMVGAAGTCVQYAVLIAGVRSGLSTPPVASCAGAALGAIVNYALNHRVTFRSSRGHAGAAGRFMAVAACAVGLNWAAMLALVSGLGVQYLVAQCLTTVVVMLLTYALNASWSFRPLPGSS